MTISLDSYQKAQFFKCALQVNPASYIRYRGQTQSLSEDEYNQALLNASLEAGIKIIGLADHGSVKEVDVIRDLFNQHNLVVFPGFEIASSEKVHFVCLFAEDTTIDVLYGYLGALGVDFENPAAPVNKSAANIIDYIDEQDGFIFAAHSTQDDGVLKRRLNHIWRHEKLLAAQIPGSVEDLKGVESDFYRKVFLNKNPDYRRERKMAALNSADVAKPEDILSPGASSLIKMTKPCFASFKQAFLDAESRVRLNSEKTENYASAIEHIRIVGGYLDGLDIELSEHLNAVIGGRGTGKSTLLECIRFAFDLEPKTTDAQKQHRAIIENNLGKERGMVELTLRSAKILGRKFKVSRKYGSASIVTDESGEVSPYRPLDLLPNIELYGQNEIYELTRDEQSRNRLIERFLDSEHSGLDEKIIVILARLKENRSAIIHAQTKTTDIEAEVEQLPKLEDQAKQFQALGLDEKLKIIPKLEKEKQLNSRATSELQRIEEAMATLKDSLPDTLFLSDTSLDGLPHADLLQKQRKILDALKHEGEVLLANFEQLTKKTQHELTTIQQQLLEKHQEGEQRLEQAFKEIPASQGKTGREIGIEYQQLLKRIEQIRPQQLQLQNRQMQIKALFNQRKKYMLELEQYTSARASSMQKSTKHLNRKLAQKIQLDLKPEGNRQILVDFLLACDLEGIGQKRLIWVMEQDFSPSKLAESVRQGEEKIKNNFNISDSVVRGLMRLTEKQLLELEEIVLPDTMDIQLNIAHEKEGTNIPVFRAINELSTGQQCTAILHLLLLDNYDPLILDQPEDNLDNAFIAERIVSELRRAKLVRQFLFATHNANIPVFGDAEWIGVLSAKEGKGVILPDQQGAIDMPEVQKLAADILEGGKSAFNQRREKYGFS